MNYIAKKNKEARAIMVKITSKMCLNDDVGVYGNMFGGRLLSIMDESAAIFARLYTGEKRIVSRKFSGVEFHSPVKLGEILCVYADNPKHGTTSFSFDIVVIVNETRRFQASCVFVAVDADGRKKTIDWSHAPKLNFSTRNSI